MDYSSIANLPNLGPGSTGGDVLTLQNWLVKNGYMTQDQLNTGPGIYGPKTTAAVAQWQSQMGFDTQGNPGWFGPISKTYIQQQTAQNSPSTTTTTPTTTTTTSTMSPQKALITAIADVAQTAAATGAPPVSFADALALAEKDPNIISKYADMAKLDAQAFTQQLQQMQTMTTSNQGLYKTQFENERQALAEKNAAAGTAYSGFRGKAQADLAQQQAGIVTSSRSQIKSNLDNLTSAFESKYGTGLTPPAAITFDNPLPGSNSETITGQVAGGITGTVTPAKTADINQTAINSYNTALFPKV